jgi:hypothetical protein
MVTCSHTSLTLFRVNPAVTFQIVGRKDTSRTLSLGREAFLSPGGIVILASIPLEPRRVLGSRAREPAAVRSPLERSCWSVLGDGFPDPEVTHRRTKIIGGS